MFVVSEKGTSLIADVTLVLTLALINTSSISVSESVNGLFFLANNHAKQSEAAVALSCAVHRDRIMVAQLRLQDAIKVCAFAALF